MLNASLDIANRLHVLIKLCLVVVTDASLKRLSIIKNNVEDAGIISLETLLHEWRARIDPGNCREAVLGPEETVESFLRADLAGNWSVGIAPGNKRSDHA
ncbi:MAG: hypothetical protein AAF657_25850, partial [Acidobacteriota bacterium]